MPVFVGCPSCGIKISVAESLLGRQVRCASCLKMFAASETPAVPPPRARRDVDEQVWDDPPAAPPSPPDTRGRRDADHERRRRGSWQDDDYDDRSRPPIRRDQVPHRGAFILTLGIVSIVAGAVGPCIYGLPAFIALPAGLSAWFMGQNDLREIDKGVMDLDGRTQTQSGCICGIIGTVFGLLDVLWGLTLLALLIAGSI